MRVTYEAFKESGLEPIPWLQKQARHLRSNNWTRNEALARLIKAGNGALERELAHDEVVAFLDAFGAKG